MENISFLKTETFGLRTQETFVGNKCEIYIPTSFINKNASFSIATELGDRLETIGIFLFKVNGELYFLAFPLKFQFQFSSVEKKRLKLKPNIKEDEYFIYTLKKGDAFIYDVLHQKNIDDISNDFVAKLIENGKIPQYVSYDDVLQLFINVMSASTYTNLAVSSVSLEFLLSELYRSKDNTRDPFRFAYNGNNEYSYKMIRITKVPQLNSTFTGLIGESINDQLVDAVVKKRENVKEKESPIEKIIKY